MFVGGSDIGENRWLSIGWNWEGNGFGGFVMVVLQTIIEEKNQQLCAFKNELDQLLSAMVQLQQQQQLQRNSVEEQENR